MFVTAGRLEHVLPPSAYHGQESFDRERAGLFAAAWHIVGLADRLARPGDYLACTVAGRPVVVRRTGDGLRAFANACAHRHAALRPSGCGRQERLACQYHGWEYNDEGRVAKIPDGVSFKGIKAEDFRLPRHSACVRGPFAWVNLLPDAPPLADQLGGFADEFDRYFGAHRLFAHWGTDHAVNWKVIVENAVESYHVPAVHPTTFRNYRAPELHDHTLAETYTRYADLQPLDAGLVAKGFRVLAKLLLREPNYERFKHTHLFPAMLLYYGELMSTLTVVQPTGPAAARYDLYAFVPRDVKLGPLGRGLQDLSSWVLLRQLKRILCEDMAIWPELQRGLEASGHQGVLGCREERIWKFQAMVAAANRAAQAAGDAQVGGATGAACGMGMG